MQWIITFLACCLKHSEVNWWLCFAEVISAFGIPRISRNRIALSKFYWVFNFDSSYIYPYFFISVMSQETISWAPVLTFVRVEYAFICCVSGFYVCLYMSGDWWAFTFVCSVSGVFVRLLYMCFLRMSVAFEWRFRLSVMLVFLFFVCIVFYIWVAYWPWRKRYSFILSCVSFVHWCRLCIYSFSV